MIKISVRILRGEIREVQVSGHGEGKKGSDIVCAAVSAVSQAALRGLLSYGKEEIFWEKRSGFLRIRVVDSPSESRREVLGAILTSMVLGLQEIASQYPARIALRLRGARLSRGVPGFSGKEKVDPEES